MGLYSQDWQDCSLPVLFVLEYWHQQDTNISNTIIIGKKPLGFHFQMYNVKIHFLTGSVLVAVNYTFTWVNAWLILVETSNKFLLQLFLSVLSNKLPGIYTAGDLELNKFVNIQFKFDRKLVCSNSLHSTTLYHPPAR